VGGGVLVRHKFSPTLSVLAATVGGGDTASRQKGGRYGWLIEVINL